MTLGPVTVGTLRQPAAFPQHRASWYTQGRSDELGDRLLMFDNTGGASLELLRFRRSLVTPRFEQALRTRVERLRQFRHPAFATIRGVEYLETGEGLALVSDHVAGKRLSDILQQSRGDRLAVSLIRQLSPALAALQQFDAGIGHGALAASRISIGPGGRLVIVEHVLGPALAELPLSPESFGRQFGILVPPSTGTARSNIDERTDCFQLALMALSLIAGRAVTPEEYPHGIARLLASRPPQGAADEGERAVWLDDWLRRALHLGGRPFESAVDAFDAYLEMSGSSRETLAPESPRASLKPAGVRLLDPIEARVDTESKSHKRKAQVVPLRAPSPETAPTTAETLVTTTEAVTAPAVVTDFEDSDRPEDPLEEDCSSPAEGTEGLSPYERALVRSGAKREDASVLASTESGQRGDMRRQRLRVVIAALALVAVAEAVVIARLVWIRMSRPAPAVLSEGVAPTPASAADEVSVDTSLRAAVEPGRRAPAPDRSDRLAVRTAAAGAPIVRPSRPSTGRIRFVSPVALEIYEGDRLLGSTATGIVSAPAGRRELELVNSTIGFRVRQTVTVRADRVVSVNVSPPNGRVHINAMPWAQVWIDGRSVGETPVGNLSLPAGEHEILFRHPQLGEHRQTAIVRVDGITRVTANLQR